MNGLMRAPMLMSSVPISMHALMPMPTRAPMSGRFPCRFERRIPLMPRPVSGVDSLS